MPTQVELNFRANAGGTSQNERLRDYFRDHPNTWIPMPELAKIITPTGIGAAVHSRVADCRSKFGMTIEQRSERTRADGLTKSFYLYRPEVSPG